MIIINTNFMFQADHRLIIIKAAIKATIAKHILVIV